ncbi:MAG: YdiU family protein [Colwellia sp.]|nr:YdiU family protein [Colwellia sp.]MCW8865378.1 YdiU family protein [Colwellia sp.]MCW9080722.1 YdiU family protein [Colwellia sp.]
MKFSNTYIDLGEKFFQRSAPQKSPSPELLLWNSELASRLQVPEKLASDHEVLSQYFSGNKQPKGAEPIALAYSGHQFGHFNPQLGDGRAHLLGEVLDSNDVRRDIQLKGSGQTAFSRRGDGKCALAPALREYIMSEAMFALGVPTSRCLAVVSTGELIHRGLAKAGAVVTRVAASHIRVGTFQYFAARGDITSLNVLLDYSIERHFPEITRSDMDSTSPSREQCILGFLEKTIAKQITLVVEWLRVGFIHGVMNTDNTAISGETIDFGPCAMLGIYHENAVFSSIDEYGRYAFASQAKIAQWNMARLADCLLPLLIEADQSDHDNKEQQALAKVETLVVDFTAKFERAYDEMYAAKLGLAQVNATNKHLVKDLLALMQTHALDYTLTFAQLTKQINNARLLAVDVWVNELPSELEGWFKQWQLAIDKSVFSRQEAQALMQKNNPVVIPRNHHVETILAHCEEAVSDCLNQNSLDAFTVINNIVSEFLQVLCSPYQELEATKSYQDKPEDGDQYYQTFCGT